MFSLQFITDFRIDGAGAFAGSGAVGKAGKAAHAAVDIVFAAQACFEREFRVGEESRPSDNVRCRKR